MASVLELFSWRKLRVIHALISSRQVVRVEDGDATGWSTGLGKEMVLEGCGWRLVCGGVG